MLPGQFLRALAVAVRPYLPVAGEPLHVQPRGRLLQIWYGRDGSVHYEVWMHERTQQMELGLHCEATPERNARLRQALAGYLLEIKHALGNGVELEDWDRGWVRLYETHALLPLDERRLDAFAQRVGRFVTIMQPIYTEIRETLRFDG